MIEVENVSKHYGETEAVRDVSFRVNAGEVVGFVGPNGAGKTTTMKILACLMPPTAGMAKIAGFRYGRQLRRRAKESRVSP